MRSRFTLVATFLGLSGLCAWYAARVEGQGAAGIDQHKDFAKVQAIFQKHCFECHGQKKKPMGQFNVTLLDHLKAKVMPEAPGQVSRLWELMSSKDENAMMPPVEKPRVPPDELAIVEKWIKDVSTNVPPPVVDKPVVAAGPEARALANEVKEIFRQHCFECHGDNAPKNGVKMLDHNLLVNLKRKVKPGKLNDSSVYKLILAKDETVMPPPEKPRMDHEQVIKVMEWINAGAPAWDADVAAVADQDAFFRQSGIVGVGYVLERIRDDIRQIPTEERRYVRYLSINHLLVKGTTDEELIRYRKALTKAINHLSWERDLVELRAVDVHDPNAPPPPPVEPVIEGQTARRVPSQPTVFAIDLRRLGWDRYYYEKFAYGSSGKMENQGESKTNLYDLALLEYPYGTIYYNSPVYDQVYVEYLQYSGMTRPIPYVRGDWFCSVVTQHPLYEDILQLPMVLNDGKGYGLEPRLGVDAEHNLLNGRAVRAGMILSGVSRNNRIVERHDAKFGHYWKSIDFQTSTGGENMFRNPITPDFTGGEMIFNLPNGLQGYLVTDNRGNRINEAPTSIVVDKFASDKVVRNGLACMRCHDQGVKDFRDTVRPVVEKMQGRTLEFDPRDVFALYPPHEPDPARPNAPGRYMIDYLKRDKEIFANAYQKMLGEAPPATSPLTPVSQRFIDDALDLNKAAAELGYRDPKRLEAIFTLPQFTAIGVLPLGANGLLRRDAWDDYYDQVVSAVGMGDPVINLDGLNRPNYQTNHAVKVTLTTVDHKTGKPKKTYIPGDKLFINVVNEGPQDVYVELVGTSSKGQQVILAPATTLVKAKSSYRYPANGAPLEVKGGAGKELITMYCCQDRFPGGVVLKMKQKELFENKWMFDRVVHPFYAMRRVNNRIGLYYDGQGFRPDKMVKKTIAIETQ